ncbi:MAG: hypothetical protein IH936_10260 [Acidobacteria bacterium]|nr:hypothetical protein [Acidobacteriota bacterium]
MTAGSRLSLTTERLEKCGFVELGAGAEEGTVLFELARDSVELAPSGRVQ